MKDDGLVVASIPNFLYYKNLKTIILDADFKYEESGILDKTHLRFFAKKNIIDLFQQNSLQVTLITSKFDEEKGKTYFSAHHCCFAFFCRHCAHSIRAFHFTVVRRDYLYGICLWNYISDFSWFEHTESCGQPAFHGNGDSSVIVCGRYVYRPLAERYHRGQDRDSTYVFDNRRVLLIGSLSISGVIH